MKHQIFSLSLLTAILLCFNVSFGQAKRYPFEEITLDCKCPEFEWGGMGRELKNIKESTNDFEIRLDVYAKWSNRMSTIISRNNGVYEAHYYHKLKNNNFTVNVDSLIKYKGKWEEYNFKKFRIEGYNLDSITKLLLKNGLISLPNQNEVYKKGFMSSYIISYKIDGKLRSFVFGYPEDAMREYPDEPIYRQYKALLDIFFGMTNPMYNQIWGDINIQQEKERRDTIFLRKPNAKGHAVYVDKDEDNSPYFDVVRNIDYTIPDKNDLKSIDRLQKYNKRTGPVNLHDLPQTWVELHRYKGEYYIYAPAKVSETKVSLSASTMIVRDAKNEIRLIDSVQQTDKNNFLVTNTDVNGKTRVFNIYMLHWARSLAIFEDFYGKGKHQLMVGIEDAYKFSIITNNSPKHDDPEYEFEMPDFEKLKNPPQFFKRRKLADVRN
ncbi:MAG: hypothetical protein V4687_18075 [Bacteroidota bacterium]